MGIKIGDVSEIEVSHGNAQKVRHSTVYKTQLMRV